MEVTKEPSFQLLSSKDFVPDKCGYIFLYFSYTMIKYCRCKRLVSKLCGRIRITKPSKENPRSLRGNQQ